MLLYAFPEVQAITRSTAFFLVAFCSFASYPVVAFCCLIFRNGHCHCLPVFQPVQLFTFLSIIVLSQ